MRLFESVGAGIGEVVMACQSLTTRMVGEEYYALMTECLQHLRSEGCAVEVPRQGDYPNIMKALHEAQEFSVALPDSDPVSVAAAAGDVLIALGGLHHRMHYLTTQGIRDSNEVARLISAAELVGVTEGLLAVAKTGILRLAAVHEARQKLASIHGKETAAKRRFGVDQWRTKALRDYLKDLKDPNKGESSI